MHDHLHGASTKQDLRAGGLGDHAITAKVRRGDLIRVTRNLYLDPASRSDRLQTAALGIKAVRGRGMVTGAAGLHLRHERLAIRRQVVDIAVPHGLAVPEVPGVDYRRSSHMGGVRPHTAVDLPVAADSWCLGDLARDLDDPALAKVAASAVAQRWMDLGRLEEEALERGRFPGRARLRRVIEALRSDLPFSGTERRAALALRHAGIDVVMQHPVPNGWGGTWLMDLAVVPLKLNLEIDGPHHWLPEQAASDRRRDRVFRGRDWAVERFAVYDIDRDIPAFVGEVQGLVASRRRELYQ